MDKILRQNFRSNEPLKGARLNKFFFPLSLSAFDAKIKNRLLNTFFMLLLLLFMLLQGNFTVKKCPRPEVS